ncbi:MAG TPA: TonB-dependent receptor [Vicinamibacterales bacterium]|nr:TonB-dependent receptor [Vicinamibacterales bacterium]
MRLLWRAAALAAVACVFPAAARAQATLAGTVRDTSGAVLPGVTVEAASPVLIERVRTTVSDGTGQYRLTELSPGTYSLTFTLPGFQTVRRDNVELSGLGVTTINIEMRVGAVEETITVTGETPVVDIQSTRRQTVVDDETLRALPATRGYNALVFLVPSITGGSNQIDLMPAMRIFYGHGGRGNEGRTYVDGLSTGSAFNGGGVSGYIIDTSNVQEMQVTTSGGLGETEVGGPQVNFIPKTGGNTFSGSFFGSGAGDWSMGSNLDDRLRSFGIPEPPTLYKNWDLQASLGGPFRRDRLWFFATYRDFGSHDDILGMYANKNAGDPTKWTYERNPDVKARNAVSRTIAALRLTAQVTPRNKVGFYWDHQFACDGSALTRDADTCRKPGTNWVASGTSTIAPEAASGAQGTAGGAFGYADAWQKVWQATWTSPVTNKLLLEAGASTYISKWGWMEQPGAIRNLIQVQEQNSFDACPGPEVCLTPANLVFRALDWNFNNMQNPTYMRASASYVTGAHNMKVGWVSAYNRTDNINHYNYNRLNYRTLNGVPNQLTMNFGDWIIKDRSQYHGFYVQDSWTVGRATLQGAVRYDRAWSWSPEGQGAEGPSDRFRTAPITFPRTEGVRGFNDITTRWGVAYDLFGTGKTSLKVNLGKYLQSANNQDRYTLMNPAQATRFARTTNRAWTDANGNWVPDCDLMNPAAQDLRASGGDFCGPWANINFGRALPAAAVNPAILEGWGVRPSDWQFGASVQHELLPRVSVEVGYNRRSFDGFTVTDNRATVASDYDRFTFTAPRHPSLPGGGGYTVTAFNPNPRIAATADNYVTFADEYGKTIQYWHGVDVNVNARLRGGLTVQGGTSTGRGVRDNCEVVAKLPELLFAGGVWQRPESCRVEEPWLTQLRGLAAYTVPKVDVQIGVGFQFKPGTLGIGGNDAATNGQSVSANFLVPSAVAAQTLGRPLSLGAANTTVNLLLPGELYGERVNQVDVRLAKVLRFGRTRALVGFDVYNLFNDNPGLSYNQAFGVDGSTWLRPTSLLLPRFVRFNATVDF